MTLSIKHFLVAAALMLASLAYASPIYKIIVPFPPGGGNDNMARFVSRHLSDAGVTNVVINRPGGNGVVGIRSILSENDPYTLVIMAPGPGLILPLTGELDYDVLKEFQPVTGIATGPSVLIVPANSPYKNLTDLIKALQTSPKGLTFGSGSAFHRLESLRFLQSVNGRGVEVPYTGTARASVAVASGEIDFALVELSSVNRDLAAANRLRILALGTQKSLPSLATVSTFMEQGVNYESGTWYLLFAKRGMPADDVTKINKIIREALIRDSKNPMLGFEIEVLAWTPQQTEKFFLQQHNIFKSAIDRSKSVR